MIVDRDSNITAAFEAILKDNGVELVKIPPGSPNCKQATALRSLKNPGIRSEFCFGVVFETV